MTPCVHIEVSVQTQETQDNSDDDVIEVVRDEAPIEILSDGEELEIQLQQSQDALMGIVIENERSSIQVTENIVEKEKENEKDPAEDPLKTDTHNSFCSDLLDALNPSNQPHPIGNSISVATEFNTNIAIDSNASVPKELSENVTAISINNAQENSDRIETIVPNDDGLIADLKI